MTTHFRKEDLLEKECMLAEREKELSCIYAILDLTSRKNLSIDDVLEQAVLIIPKGWQHPELTVCRITYAGHSHASPGWRKTPFMLHADMQVNGTIHGMVEVGYTEDPTLPDDPVFLEQEVELIHGLATRLGAFLAEAASHALVLANEAKYATLLDGISDLIDVADPDTYELLYINKTFENLFGRGEIGKKCHKVLQNLDEPCPFCSNDNIFGSHLGETYEWDFQNKVTGRWYRCSDKAIKWTDGKMVRFELANDITDRKRDAEKILRITTAIDGSSEAVRIFDPDGNHFYQNRAFTELFGYEPHEFEHQSPKILYADREEADLVFETVMQGGSWSGELNMRAKNGRIIPVMLKADAVIDDHGRTIALIGLHTDISARKAMERKLRDTLDEVVRSNKELEQFAYVASHDLQEPLRMVSSFTQLLGQKYGDQLDDKAQTYIDYAIDGAVRMQRLIQDLLKYSRINTRGGDPEPTDSHQMLGQALANLSALIVETGALVSNDELPMVLADPSQLVQLFQNLIANGIKFRGEKHPVIHVGAEKFQGMWRFSVSDNGIGIEDEYREKIFVIFQRLHTRTEYPGTGIGLAVCKRIVERHGGTIRFTSEPGKGTTFYFTLKPAPG